MRRGLSGFLAALGLLALMAAGAFGQVPSWKPLAQDDLHDPAGPAVNLLQQPAAALSVLPPDGAGNMVRWVKALEEGHIQPRTALRQQTKVQVYDKDVLLNLKGGMPVVRFPHKAHTEWLDCSNCHDHLFKKQAGATKISMFRILSGEQCGLCHGAVSFPLTECSRCHSVSHAQARKELEGQSR